MFTGDVKWKFTFDKYKDLSEKDEKYHKFYASLDEEKKKEAPLPTPAEGVRIKVKFSQYNDSTVAIEFTRLAGSAAYYRESLEWMKSSLADFIDASAE